ncbi:uncharacterized protein B0H64DRAFT_379291 [Chaetomium fimeti]|uniref:F-box domain-containing protein n=1 Tax=Chaetomium fimeti TaxID=1854472 RepID=A0AAE0LW66_9PEZI|nr:hypothetical protein B0H64DRAFT_379291 [Chaetomium fimeti]
MTQNIHVTERQPPGRAHSVGLVGLPPHIRRRIYLHAGVARFDGHPYTYLLGGRNRSVRLVSIQLAPDPSNFQSPPTRNFAGLLRSCRALYVETAALFYSANRFVVFYSPRDSFKNLRALSPTSLASLTSLKIVLNQSCDEPIDPSRFPPYCWCWDHPDESWSANHHCFKDRWPRHGAQPRDGQHRRPLLDHPPASHLTVSTSAEHEVQAMTGEWSDAVASISPHIGIGRLELFFVCDIDPQNTYALEAARLALAPVTLFPRLRDCHVRLSKKPSYALQQVAQAAVLQACDKASPARLGPADLKRSSALTNLPPELRVRILEYTDLITPWKEVTWSRQHRGYQLVQSLCSAFSSRDNGKCPADVHNGCRLHRCDPDLDADLGYAPLTGCCFCRVRHSAASFACNCWAPPTYLFLICRTLYQDAEFVFFSRNRFIVHDFHAREPCTSTESYYPFDRLAASEFLRDIIPTHCLAHLRFLELVFPPYVPHGWPGKDHPAILDWVATVGWARSRINAPALTLRVVMADFHTGPATGRTVMTEALVDGIGIGQSCIFNPLKPLIREEGGLANFYMQVAHPARWTEDFLYLVHRAEVTGDHEFLERLHRDFNEAIERRVRGPAGLRRGNRDNAEPSESTWQRWRGVDLHSA